MRKSTIQLMGILFVAGSGAVFGQATTSTTAPASSATVSTTLGEAKTSSLLKPMQQMITKLKSLQPTGDPDFDFAFVAKVHTQGSQDLLNAILQTSPDSALTQTIRTMLSTAKTDMTAVTGLMKALKPTRPNAAFTKQQNRTIAAIGEKIKQSGYKLTDDLDKNIAVLLSDQWQDAINLASGYLQFGRNTALRNFAQQSIEKAKLDISVLKDLRTANK